MNKITKFVAVDGTEFNSENECLEYEMLINKVNGIMAKLPALPAMESTQKIAFDGGNYFFQHDKILLHKVKISLLQEIQLIINHRWIQDTIDSEDVHPSWVQRLLGDYGIKPLEKAWYRFCCIDKYSREWGQPYFVSKPNGFATPVTP